MDYQFDQYGKRMEGVCWLKPVLTPRAIRENGYPSFSGAEFEFATCPAYCRGAAEAVSKGMFGFTIAGDVYKNHVCWWMREVRHTGIDPEWIIPTQGTIFSAATTIRMFVGPEDALMILTPGYNRYEQAANRLGRRTVKIPMKEEKGFYSMDLKAIEEAMKVPENKVLVFSNPNNPCGTIFEEKELRKLTELAVENKVVLFSDEIFADVAFQNQNVPCLAALAGEDAPVISCTGMGKTFSLTGVNHANILIKNPLLREAFLKQRDADHYGSLDPVVHAGLISAYSREGKEWLEALKSYIWENYRMVDRFLKEHLPEVIVTQPQGTYVVWLDYTAFAEKYGMDEEELYRFLEEDAFFAGDRGEEYYGKPFTMRYALCLPAEGVRKSLQALGQAADRLQTV